MTGVAVKDTRLPVQTVVAEAAMATPACVLVFTSIVMAFDVAGFSVAQERFEVIWQVTKSPFTGE